MEEIKTAATQAKNFVDELTHLSELNGKLPRVDLYINLLKAKAGVPLKRLPPSVRGLVTGFTKNGVTDWNKLTSIFRGSAIQAKTDALLKVNSGIAKQLIFDGELLLNHGSQVGKMSRRHRLLRPDYQLQLSDTKWATLDLTTRGEAGKILKYNHRRSPFLIELYH